MQIDTSLLTITNLSMEAIDEWVCFTIKFIYRGPERPDLSDDCTRFPLVCALLEKDEVKNYRKKNAGRKIMAGQDGSYPEIEVLKPVFIPNSPVSFSDWNIGWENVNNERVIVGYISASER